MIHSKLTLCWCCRCFLFSFSHWVECSSQDRANKHIGGMVEKKQGIMTWFIFHISGLENRIGCHFMCERSSHKWWQLCHIHFVFSELWVCVQTTSKIKQFFCNLCNPCVVFSWLNCRIFSCLAPFSYFSLFNIVSNSVLADVKISQCQLTAVRISTIFTKRKQVNICMYFFSANLKQRNIFEQNKTTENISDSFEFLVQNQDYFSKSGANKVYSNDTRNILFDLK